MFKVYYASGAGSTFAFAALMTMVMSHTFDGTGL